ncbi:MAG: CoA transferase, partial [Dehalococcoidia bacterium]|nr:CoA transferase [Dehalococcoidia bacterium]
MQALENLAVLDLTRIGPGPLCTMLLGDMGADVLRVQAPEQVSQQSRLHRLDAEEDQRSLAYYAMGRNKRSLALDLKNPDARSIFHQLARTADVVIEGFRPGVVKRLGVGYEQLRELNPRLVYCSLSGYGQTGPYAGIPGHDINYIAMAGALSLFGGADGRPAIPLNLVADYGGGAMMAAFGILCALRARDLTGAGQQVDISMMDGVLHLLTREWSSHLETGEAPQRGQHRLGGGRWEYNVYECSDGRWISVVALPVSGRVLHPLVSHRRRYGPPRPLIRHPERQSGGLVQHEGRFVML